MLCKEENKQNPLRPENYLGWAVAPYRAGISKYYHFFYLRDEKIITCLCGGYALRAHQINRFKEAVKSPYGYIQNEELMMGPKKVKECQRRIFDLNLPEYPSHEIEVVRYRVHVQGKLSKYL
jgi:hypothetical protein